MLKNESGLVFTISGKQIQADRPAPILSTIDVVPYNRGINPNEAIEAIDEGYPILVNDFYSSGLALLAKLKAHVKARHPDQLFQGQRNFRAEYFKLSQQIVLVVRNHKLAVKKAPKIGWLTILYPELDEFLLPFPQVQGLNSSWQWYEKGISIPGLNQKIHPWFGTYFPTRFEHLSLFDHWLKNYKGEKKSAIDVGIGSGVLTFQLLKYGFEKVLGTDSNPNSIISVNEDLAINQPNSKVDLKQGNLFANSRLKSELIVFNPPWLPATYLSEGLDKAIYYDANLFPDFFAQAKKHLKAEGRVVLLFSNLAQLTNVSESHPIETELAEGGRFKKEYFVRKKASQASQKTRRNQNWRNSEMVELWVLKTTL
ncbi:MAG TPA: methyltransferase [Sunxiuqinia sp.]|nr:methyltransferase [Sunxiuqinia sp.]